MNAAAELVLTSLASGSAADDAQFAADLKTLETKVSGKLEVSARSIATAANAFEEKLKQLVILGEAASRSDAAQSKDPHSAGATTHPVIPSEARSAEPKDLHSTNPVILSERSESKDLHLGMDAARSASFSTQDVNAPPRAVRHRLSEERASVTHKFSIAGHDGYITVGLYPNGCPGEIFIKMAKEGSTVSGLMDAFATSISLSLQHGVPLGPLRQVRPPPLRTLRLDRQPNIGYAKSIMDYLFRWLELRFLSGQQLTLFAGMAPQPSIPVLGTLGDDAQGVLPTLHATHQSGVILSERSESKDLHLGMDAARSASQSGVIPSEARSAQPRDLLHGDPAARSASQSGVILSEAGQQYRPAQSKDLHVNNPAARSASASPDLAYTTKEEGFSPNPIAQSTPNVAAIPGVPGTPGLRAGVVHAADAMRELVDMGDAPSCHTCGAIMVRNGSCYRCMSCGSTSGCS